MEATTTSALCMVQRSGFRPLFPSGRARRNLLDMNELNGLCGRVPKKAVFIVMAAGIVLLLVYHISSSTPGSFYDSDSMTSSQEEQRFPQAIIIGVKKGGTRALISMLDSHPQVESARGEVHFFDRNENFRKGLRWYVQQMPFTAPNEIAIEKSPSYFITPYVPDRLHSMSPSTKVILIVRDPIERTISDYIQLFNPDRIGQQKSFNDVVLDGPNHINDRAQVIRVSCYDLHIVHWLKYFPLEQIHIVNGDALISNPAQEMIRVQNYLGVSDFFTEDMFYYNKTKGFYCWHKVTDKGDVHPNCLGSSKGHQHPKISENTRKLLKEYFFAHNEQFYKLVGRDFRWNT